MKHGPGILLRCSLLLLILPLLLVSCSGGVSDCADQMQGWELPADLCRYQAQLRSLDLPPQVDELGWFHENLRNLAISNSRLSSLEDLPAGLERLVLRSAGITALGELPAGLVLLDLEETPVDSLAGLPPGLEQLSVFDVEAKGLLDLPAGLRRLRLRADRRHYNRLDMLPPGLQRLDLAGLRLLSLEGLPEELERLTLERVRLRSGLLPRELRRMRVRLLVVVGTSPVQSLPRHLRALEIDSVPPSLSVALESPYLEELVITRDRMPAADSLPRFLGRLEAAGGRDLTGEPVAVFSGLRSLRIDGGVPPGSLPEGLEELALTNCRDEHVTTLPGSLEILDLSACSLDSLPDLPPGLQDLNLSLAAISTVVPKAWPPDLRSLTWQGYPAASLGNLPDTLRHLDLSNAGRLRVLEELPPDLETLKLGNTGFTSLPADLPDSLLWLDVSGTGVSRLSGLPEGLAALVLSTGQLETLEGLPASVRYLAFVDPLGAGPLLTELDEVDLLGPAVEGER